MTQILTDLRRFFVILKKSVTIMSDLRHLRARIVVLSTKILKIDASCLNVDTFSRNFVKAFDDFATFCDDFVKAFDQHC